MTKADRKHWNDRLFTLANEAALKGHQVVADELFALAARLAWMNPQPITHSTDYTRFEDMSPDGRLSLLVQEDGDIIVTVWPSSENRTDCGLPVASVEFCTPSNGGGQSRHTWAALGRLVRAIAEDNAERSQEWRLKAWQDRGRAELGASRQKGGQG